MSSILQVKNLNVKFGDLPILKNLSFEVEKGDILAVIGPNGAGKTVLFRALLELIPYQGKIEWQKNIKIGYVPQKISVDKDLPLNTFEFLKFKNVPLEETMEALSAVGLINPDKHDDQDKQNPNQQNHHPYHHLLNTKLGELSGGELQRVLIAYAIIGHPDVLLFDEPTAGVDIGGEETIYSLLKKLQQKNNLTIILISHDLNIIYQHANNILCLNKEKVCYGPAHKTLTKKAIQELYGHQTGFYEHGHN